MTTPTKAPKATYGSLAKLRQRPGDVQGLLRCLGANSTEAQVVAQSVWLKIRETDHDSHAAVVLTTLLQKAMGLPPTGMYDRVTATALERLYGPNVLEASWLRVLEAAQRARAGAGAMPGVPAAQPLSGLGGLWDTLTSLFAPAPTAVPAVPTTQDRNALQRVAPVAPVKQASPQWKLPGNMTVVPLNALTKAAYVDLQKQANRFAHTLDLPMIGVDGIIGKATISLAYSAVRWSANNVAPVGGKIGDQAWLANKAQTSDLEWWAGNATVVASMLKANGDRLRLPATGTAGALYVAAAPLDPLAPLVNPVAPSDNTVLYGALGIGAFFLLFKGKGKGKVRR